VGRPRCRACGCAKPKSTLESVPFTSKESEELRGLGRETVELRRVNEILKTASAFFTAELDRPHALVTFIDENRDRFGEGEPVCIVLTERGCPIVPSTYRTARSWPAAPRSVRDTRLKTDIARVHAASYGVYGAEKV
jgi:hypothetical protein